MDRGSSESKRNRRRIDMQLGDVTQHNIMQLKRINQVVFPVTYNDKFYKDVVCAGELAKLTYFNDIVVGGVCCKVDTSQGKRRLYIMTLGCLAPYRRYGLGTMMLDHVFKLCRRDPSIESVYLHVQVSNDGALAFYQRNGFEIVETTKNYYKRIEPADAYLLERKIARDEIVNCKSPSSTPTKNRRQQRAPANSHGPTNSATLEADSEHDSGSEPVSEAAFQGSSELCNGQLPETSSDCDIGDK